VIVKAIVIRKEEPVQFDRKPRARKQAIPDHVDRIATFFIADAQRGLFEDQQEPFAFFVGLFLVDDKGCAFYFHHLQSLRATKSTLSRFRNAITAIPTLSGATDAESTTVKGSGFSGREIR